MSLKSSLRNRPVIYEIVPPRKDTSRFHTELRGVEDVLHDSRITAINVPELVNRREQKGRVHYSPATIPPEEYALMIKEYKESIVNVIAPRLPKEEFLRRARRVLHEYGIPNLVLVGRERHDDVLPGPEVLQGLRFLKPERRDLVALGGICIFGRRTRIHGDGRRGSFLDESLRVFAKAKAGCDFVTSQIAFDPRPALEFLVSYQKLCDKAHRRPLTVFVSLTTVPSLSILGLIDSLDVTMPPRVRKRLLASSEMAKESQRISAEVFRKIMEGMERFDIQVPVGLQIEQVGVNSGDLSLELLDSLQGMLH